MAPALGRGKKKDVHAPAAEAPPTTEALVPVENKTPVAMISPQEQEFRAKLKELRDHLTKNADNVGAKFPEEARKMHYGESKHRSIYGEASPQEAKELLEEGRGAPPASGTARRAQLAYCTQINSRTPGHDEGDAERVACRRRLLERKDRDGLGEQNFDQRQRPHVGDTRQREGEEPEL
jgi:hypothetical protein